MLEIRLHTLLLLLAGILVLLALPFLQPYGRQEPAQAARPLPTPTPVPTQGLSQRARRLAASLLPPATPDALPTALPPRVTATVHTQGAHLNIRQGPGLHYPVLGQAPNGAVFAVTALSPDQRWLQVAVPGWQQPGWLYASFTQVAGDLAILPTAHGE